MPSLRIWRMGQSKFLPARDTGTDRDAGSSRLFVLLGLLDPLKPILYGIEKQLEYAEASYAPQIYDVTSFSPRQAQALPLRDSFCGLAWNPNGREFYASGGVDDTVYVFARKGLACSRAALWLIVNSKAMCIFKGKYCI